MSELVIGGVDRSISIYTGSYGIRLCDDGRQIDNWRGVSIFAITDPLTRCKIMKGTTAASTHLPASKNEASAIDDNCNCNTETVV